MKEPILCANEVYELIPDLLARSIFILHFKWGLEDDEIAEVFNVDEESIKICRDTTIQHLKLVMCPPVDYDN